MNLRKAATIALSLAVGPALAGCFEDEPRPVVLYKPGVYQGKPDQPLSDAARTALRLRAERQFTPLSGLSATAPAAGGPSAGSSVRLPRATAVDLSTAVPPALVGAEPADSPPPVAGPPGGAGESGLSRSALESQRTRLLLQLGR